MATTEELPSGRFRGIYRDANGDKRHTPAVDRKRDAKRDADDAEVKARRQAAAAQGKLGGSVTWAEWHPIWWDARSVEPSTLLNEAAFIRLYIMPHWGKRRLNMISRQEIQMWINGLLKDGMSESYVRRLFTVFRSSITAAVDEEVLTASPIVKIKVPGKRYNSATTPARLYSPDELDAIQSRLSDEYRLATGLILETGLRPAELGGLHRSKIDRASGWIAVAETFDHTAQRIKAYPKDEDPRDVPLTSRALDLLAEWKELRPSTRRSCGVPHQSGKCKSDLVGRQPMSGGPISPPSLWTAWKKAQVRAGIEHLGSPYDLRHCYATRLADAGVDPWEIARILGHSSLEQTGDYVHRTTAARLKVLAALGDPAATLGSTSGRRGNTESQQSPTTVPRAAS